MEDDERCKMTVTVLPQASVSMITGKSAPLKDFRKYFRFNQRYSYVFINCHLC